MTNPSTFVNKHKQKTYEFDAVQRFGQKSWSMRATSKSHPCLEEMFLRPHGAAKQHTESILTKKHKYIFAAAWHKQYHIHHFCHRAKNAWRHRFNDYSTIALCRRHEFVEFWQCTKYIFVKVLTGVKLWGVDLKKKNSKKHHFFFKMLMLEAIGHMK